jgi:SAM-dependent methyltransferase
MTSSATGLLSKSKSIFNALYSQQISEPRSKRIVQGISELIGIEGPMSSLLDVGGGEGGIALQVSKKVGANRVSVIDIKLREKTMLPIHLFDGQHIPYDDGEFDVVMISDVLHHAEDPLALFKECVRVARHCVVVKDHVAYGKLSRYWLYAMDVAGNARVGVKVLGNYFTLPQWIDMIRESNAHMTRFRWPFVVHTWPWPVLAPSRLMFSISSIFYFSILANHLEIGKLVFDIHTLFYAQTGMTIGLLGVVLGIIVRMFGMREGLLREHRLLERLRRKPVLEIGGLTGIALMAFGIYLCVRLLTIWGDRGFGGLEYGAFLRSVSLSTLLMTLGGIGSLFSLIMGFLALPTRREAS